MVTDVETGRAWRGTWKGTGVLAAVIFMIQCLSPSPQVGDSRLSAITAWQFITHFNLHLESYPLVTHLTARHDIVSHGGHLLPFYPWPTMLFAIPGDLVYALSGHHVQTLSITNPNHTWLIEVPTASLMVTVTALLLRAFVIRIDGPWGGRRLGTVTALAFAFLTSAWSVGSRALWQQTASMLFLTIAVVAAQRIDTGRRWPWIVGLATAASFTVRPTDAVFVALVLVWVVWWKRTAIVGTFGGAAIVAVVFGLFSADQYGSVLPPYFLPGHLGDSAPFSFVPALAMDMVSPSRGLLFYDPIVILAVVGVAMRVKRRRLTDLDVILAIASLAQWVVIAAYGSPGGATYGPRLMLDIVPFLVLLSVPVLAWLLEALRDPRRGLRRATVIGVLAVLVWSLFVNGTGAAFRSAYCWSATPATIDAQPERVWDWSDPAFLRPYRDLAEGMSVTHAIAGSCTTPRTG